MHPTKEKHPHQSKRKDASHYSTSEGKKQMEKIKTVLKRDCDFYRPYYINGKRLESIVIYKDGEIILKTRSGWLEDVKEDFTTTYNGDLKEVVIDGEIKRANKENLMRKDNFLMVGERKYNFDDGYVLYIHADNIFASYEYLQKNGTDKYCKGHFLYGYRVVLKNDATTDESYLKHYNAGDTIEPCDRGKSFSAGHIRNNDGTFARDENGNLIEDGTFHCLRFRPVQKKNFIFYNGLYIKEGR